MHHDASVRHFFDEVGKRQQEIDGRQPDVEVGGLRAKRRQAERQLEQVLSRQCPETVLDNGSNCLE